MPITRFAGLIPVLIIATCAGCASLGETLAARVDPAFAVDRTRVLGIHMQLDSKEATVGGAAAALLRPGLGQPMR